MTVSSGRNSRRETVYHSDIASQDFFSIIFHSFRVSGGLAEGVIGSQTPTSLALRQEEGKEILIPRSDIKRMYAFNLSAMPDEFDRQIGVQQMADLLAVIAEGSE